MNTKDLSIEISQSNILKFGNSYSTPLTSKSISQDTISKLNQTLLNNKGIIVINKTQDIFYNEKMLLYQQEYLHVNVKKNLNSSSIIQLSLRKGSKNLLKNGN